MEHMAFNGTKDVPENEMLRILERLGLAFGADTNAFTSFDQTAYMLELPNTQDETVDTSLRVMRQMMGDALMASGALSLTGTSLRRRPVAASAPQLSPAIAHRPSNSAARGSAHSARPQNSGEPAPAPGCGCGCGCASD
jgi:hypothetical protein